MRHKEIYLQWYSGLLSQVVEQFCKPCTDPLKLNYDIDYENPLQCNCRCERMAAILDAARRMHHDLYPAQ